MGGVRLAGPALGHFLTQLADGVVNGVVVDGGGYLFAFHTAIPVLENPAADRPAPAERRELYCPRNRVIWREGGLSGKPWTTDKPFIINIFCRFSITGKRLLRGLLNPFRPSSWRSRPRRDSVGLGQTRGRVRKLGGGRLSASCLSFLPARRLHRARGPFAELRPSAERGGRSPVQSVRGN